MSWRELLMLLTVILCLVGSIIIHTITTVLHIPLLALPLDILWGFAVGRYLGMRARK